MDTKEYKIAMTQNIRNIRAVIDEYRDDPNCPASVIAALDAIVSELEACNASVTECLADSTPTDNA